MMNIMNTHEYFQQFIKKEDCDFLLSEREHYRFLTNLSDNYNNIEIYDIGTYKGYSALALSCNPSNKVISYDIEWLIELKSRPNNVEFRIGDFFTEKDVLNSPLIMFDVDPHDGIIEEKFVLWLRENSYKGTVIFDDIHVNKEMQDFWDNISEEKIDLTMIGHWSGTGMVIFK